MNALTAEIRDARKTLREDGVRAVFRKYGWKLVAGIFVYYLIRDVTLYVLIPLALWNAV